MSKWGTRTRRKGCPCARRSAARRAPAPATVLPAPSPPLEPPAVEPRLPPDAPSTRRGDVAAGLLAVACVFGTVAANLVLGFVLGAYVAPDSESALLFGGCALLLGRAAGGVLRYLCPEGSY